MLNESERSIDQRRIVCASERQDKTPVASTDQSQLSIFVTRSSPE